LLSLLFLLLFRRLLSWFSVRQVNDDRLRWASRSEVVFKTRVRVGSSQRKNG